MCVEFIDMWWLIHVKTAQSVYPVYPTGIRIFSRTELEANLKPVERYCVTCNNYDVLISFQFCHCRSHNRYIVLFPWFIQGMCETTLQYPNIIHLWASTSWSTHWDVVDCNANTTRLYSLSSFECRGCISVLYITQVFVWTCAKFNHLFPLWYVSASCWLLMKCDSLHKQWMHCSISLHGWMSNALIDTRNGSHISWVTLIINGHGRIG